MHAEGSVVAVPGSVGLTGTNPTKPHLATADAEYQDFRKYRLTFDAKSKHGIIRDSLVERGTSVFYFRAS